MPPLNLLIKPASGSCNLRCRYCFYADETENRACANFGRMSLDTAKVMVDKALAYAEGMCTFAFQGGEPSLMGVEFFRQLTEYIQGKSKNLQIQYAFQTNGTLLDEEWAAWFRDNRVLVGVSLDGPRDIHDRYRVDKDGKGTFQRVMSAVRLLERERVEYNILSVVTGTMARSGQKVYNFFQKNGLSWQQYIECLSPIGEVPGGQDYALTSQRYEQFLKAVFDAWYRDRKAGHNVYNRYFENLLMMMDGQNAETCAMQGVCGRQWVIEADGSVYPCDFYALDQWRLGSVWTDSFAAMEERRQASGFVEWSRQVPEECRNCRWFGLCRNGCRRNREPVTADHTNRNYFCAAYQGFLEYAYPRLLEIYRLVKTGAFPR
jgi:uncharacterized protein